MSCQHKQRHKILNLLDKSGACASIACAIHCVALPIILTIIPALMADLDSHFVHLVLFCFVLPVALITLGFSVWRTGKWNLFLAGLFGCSLLATGMELEHNFAPGFSSPATWTNIAGGIILATAHITNLRTRDREEVC